MDTVIDRRLHDEAPSPYYTGDELNEHPPHLYYHLPHKQVAADQRFDNLQRGTQRDAPREPIHHPSGSHIYNHHHRSQHVPGADAHYPEHARGPAIHRASSSYHDDDQREQHGNRSKEPSAESPHATRHPWMHPGTVATQPGPSSQRTASAVSSGMPQESRAVLLSRPYHGNSASHGRSSMPGEAPESRPLEYLQYPALPLPAIASYQHSERASTRIAAISSRSPSSHPGQSASPPIDVDQLDQGPSSSSHSSSHKRRAEDDVPACEKPVSKRAKSVKPKSVANAGTKRNAVGKRSGDGARVEWTYNGTLTSDLVPELQQARCMSTRYKNEQFPKCISCTRRWAGDTCRFQNLRLWLRKKDSGKTHGISFTKCVVVKQQEMQYPRKWNVELRSHHVNIIKHTVARALLPVLEVELAHLNKEAPPTGVVQRMRETECRATCDTCLTSLFSQSWMCKMCGREQCADCYDMMRDLTYVEPGASADRTAACRARRERHIHANPSFFTCGRKEDHMWSDFFPVSRFSKSELLEAIAAMEHTLRHGKHALPQRYQPTSNASSPEAVPSSTRSLSSGVSSHGPLTPPDYSASVYPPEPKTLCLNGHAHPRNQNDLGGIPCYELTNFKFEEVTKDVFRSMWANGVPFVVTGLQERLKLPWTPQYFMDTYGDQSCLIIECQDDTNQTTTVKEFFSQFGEYSSRRGCWKLKDWPPTLDFRTAFPELYDDFSQALPMPDYVRRDGVLNIASHFPLNTIVPDLGPKMYNAMASNTEHGSKGSTRLHMDMADAMNIMTYAAPKKDGTPGCAAWDLFRAEDSDKIRQFLKSRVSTRTVKGGPPGDPIHSQQVYLDDGLRKALFDEYGVKSFRFYQQAGEAVFIPAGCAHQVSNLSDCIKIAVDFVSPENIDRCERLTREFREQNHALAWKEDVLQLRSMMWFAWQSCSKQEKINGWADRATGEVDQFEHIVGPG